MIYCFDTLQLKKFRETSLGEMLRNVWTLNDLTTSFLFLIVIIIKIYNVSKYDITGAFECPAVNESLHANLRVSVEYILG